MASNLNGVTSRRASEGDRNRHTRRKDRVGEGPTIIEAAGGTSLQLNRGLTYANNLRVRATRSAGHGNLLARVLAVEVIAAENKLAIALGSKDLIAIRARTSHETIAGARISHGNLIVVVEQGSWREVALEDVNGKTTDRPRRMNGVAASVLPESGAISGELLNTLTHPIARVTNHFKVPNDSAG